VATLAVLAVACGARAEKDRSPQPLRLVIDLDDGSRIIGTPSISTLRIATDYAGIDLAFSKIRSVQIEDDKKTVSLELRNGDQLTGTWGVRNLKLTAVFGEVAVPVEHAKRIVILDDAALPSQLKRGLVLHYSFDKASGTVEDRSGNENRGVVNGARHTREGKFGGAFEFDGRNDYINAGRKPSLDITRDLTISAWFKNRRKTFGDPQQTIVGKDDGSDDVGRSYMLSWHGGSIVSLAYGKGRGRGYHILKSPRGISFDEWHHVVAIHQTGKGNRIYVDGKLVAEDREGTALLATPNTDLLVGDTKAWEQWFFFGAIDELRIYNRALSDAEIKALPTLSSL
jgi:hypothetical protein